MIAPLTTRYTIAAWILTAIALVGVIHLRLLPALLAGLLVYELVHVIAARLRSMSGSRGRITAVTLISIVIVALLVGLMFALIAFIRSDSGSLPGLLRRFAEMVEGARGKMPDWLVENLPANADRLRDAAIEWLHENSKELRIVGGEVGHTIVHILIGMVIGAMVSLREAMPASERGPFSLELLERATRMGDAFRNVVFAQVRISALNTLFTAIYLLAVLPMFDIHLPFAKSLVIVTFLAGLLPVVGNLISNSVIVIVSLNVSIDAALASLGFLIVIHKLEYFLNARIVGSHIHAKAWELLLAMLVMESAFGLAGLVAAPIYYAYLKDELNYRALL